MKLIVKIKIKNTTNKNSYLDKKRKIGKQFKKKVNLIIRLFMVKIKYNKSN